MALAQADPRSVLKGEAPRLIGEWQKAPDIWNHIKATLDDDFQFGRFILTGSTTPVDPKCILHSGTGRFSRMTLYPFSLFESGESNGHVSLGSLLESPHIEPLLAADNHIVLKDIAYLICRGGWPLSLLTEKEGAIDVTRNYYDGLFVAEDENDEYSDFFKSKDVDLLEIILKGFARNISTPAKKSRMIASILESGRRSTLDEKTFDAYYKTLKDMFIVYELLPWNANIRSSVMIRQSPVYHFFDPSIAAASLRLSPARLVKDLHSLGLFFEDLAIRDLTIYAEAIGADVSYYRDSSGLEVDAIVTFPDGDYGAVEIKVPGDDSLTRGRKSLLSFEKKMRENGNPTPAFRMILTSHGACYQGADGIYVVPINCLRP